MWFAAIAMLFLIALSSMPMVSAIPNSISIQGKLTDASGTVLTGNYDFTFYMYDALTGGNILWSESQTLAVNRGIFSAIMGDINTATTFKDLDFNATKWLAIEVDETTQTPRIKMTSTASTMRAQTANDLNSAGDNNATNISISGNTFLNNLFVSGSQIHTGDSNFTNIGISGNGFLNALFATTFRATGDSNFSDIGFSGYIFGDGSKLTGISADINGTDIAPQSIYATADINTTGDINGQTIVGAKFKSIDATTASGENAVALGKGTTASGKYSTAMGRNTIASGQASTAMGDSTEASGMHSTAMGENTWATEEYSTAMGSMTSASGVKSTAMGYWTAATWNYTTAMGHYTIASANYSTAMGTFTRASGESSTSMGSNTKASGNYSTAIGLRAMAAGQGAIAGGYGASGKGPFAIGDGAIALGYSDTNMIAGSEAAHKGAIALGYNVRSFAEAAVTLGKDLNNFNANSVVMQDLNVLGDANINSITATHFGSGANLTGIPSQTDINAAFVPYIGADYDVNVGTNDINIYGSIGIGGATIDSNGTSINIGWS